MFESKRVRSADVPLRWCALLIVPPAQGRRVDINERIVRGGAVLSTRQPFAAAARKKYGRVARRYGDRLHQGRHDVQPERDATAPIPE